MAKPQIELCATAETALALANDEATRAGARFICPHHLLLGMLREGTGGGARLLTKLGLKLNESREVARQLLTPAPREEVVVGQLPLHPFTRRAIRRAAILAAAEGQAEVNDAHLLLALIESPRRTATRLLVRLGVTPDQLRSLLTGKLLPGSPELSYATGAVQERRPGRWWQFGGR
jgi:ATP-dependent Clp protease ATP-binding subunit ClpC